MPFKPEHIEKKCCTLKTSGQPQKREKEYLEICARQTLKIDRILYRTTNR